MTTYGWFLCDAPCQYKGILTKERMGRSRFLILHRGLPDSQGKRTVLELPIWTSGRKFC